MKFDNICTKKTYKQNDVDKVVWLRCGTLRTTDDGKRFIELNHLPGITFYVFEPKSKDNQASSDVWLAENEG